MNGSKTDLKSVGHSITFVQLLHCLFKQSNIKIYQTEKGFVLKIKSINSGTISLNDQN